MKNFGFKKSGDGEDEDVGRRALFGSRSKNKSPAPSGNPYAQQNNNSNPYAQPVNNSDPYTRAKANAGVLSSGGSGGSDQKPREGSTGGGGYAPNRYGNQGYGADRFKSSPSTQDGPGVGGSRYGPGGYGGLGNVDPNAADENRDALFGGARDRLQERQQQGGPPPPYSSSGGHGQSGAYDQGNGYGDNTPASSDVYQERQLTAEEAAEEEVQSVKQEIRVIKQGDVSSTRNALRVAAMAEETGRNTLARLGAQGERILDTENALDIASSQNRLAEEKARELKTLNKSMFAVHVSNPFTSSARQRDRDEEILHNHRAERATRDATRSEQFQTSQRMERTFRDIDRQANKAPTRPQKNLAERAKYQFEADSEDDAMEDELDQNLTLLHGAASRLNGLAKATNVELTAQKDMLDRITSKVSILMTKLCIKHAY
jgi:protein transport protein SEC9